MNPGLLRFDSLAIMVGCFLALFFLLTLFYSIGFMRGRKSLIRYFLYITLTFAVGEVAVFADNLILFLVCWGLVGVLLYLLIDWEGSDRAAVTAKKCFVIVGGTDAVMLLGFGVLWHLHPGGSSVALQMSGIHLDLAEPLPLLAFLCLAVGALAKAGAMPFHTWVPDTAEDASIPVTAYLPASFDKLLGIYLLARLVVGMFQVTPLVNTLLMGIGALTIVAAAMMALIQSDMKRLLGYCAVSQAGYIVLGLGTGNPIGIAGGLFHMLNHAIYKCCLFLCAGNVESRTGTSKLDRLGGLARRMPITFGAFLVGAMAVSGIPPLNGFASKWLVYQGLVLRGQEGGGLWVLWLAAAMSGTALTLAGFMKLTHAVFLGQSHPQLEAESQARSTSPFMSIPVIALATLSILFGVFALSLPLTHFVFPAVPGEVEAIGLWDSGWATALLLGGATLGLGFYLLYAFGRIRVAPSFVGGEVLDEQPGMRVSGVEFYRTVQEMPLLGPVYRAAEAKWFDIYEVGKKLFFLVSGALGELHNGLLPRYIAWCLVGTIVVLYVLMG